jgi:flagellar protein FlaI
MSSYSFSGETMADDQSNVSEEESSTYNKNDNPEEVSSDQETDDEILNTDIRKEMSEIEQDREKFEKDFAQLLSSTGTITDEEDADNNDQEDEENDNNFGILLPKSPNFGPPKPPVTDVENETSGSVVGEETIEKEEIDADIDTEKTESITEEEELIAADTLETVDELPEEQADSEAEGNEEKPGFVDKIKNLFKQTELEIEPYDSEIHGPIAEFRGVEGYEEVERYWANEPYAFIVILYNEDRNTHLYYIVEPELTDFEHTFLLEIKDRLRDVLLVEEIDEENDDKEAVLDSKIRSIIKDYTIEITPAMLEKISYYIKRDFVRFGKIDALMMDDSIEDVSGNGHNVPIFLYHRAHQNIATNVVYEEDELNSFIIQMAQRSGKHISVAEPMVDATMPDGSRIQMTLGTSVTAHGSTFTIRKFSDTPITPVDLIKWGTFSSESMAYLWLCIENNKSLIYAGGTASGKTSSLNAVSLFIPEKAKVITLEDTRELKLPHPNWIPSITRDSFTADERGAVDMYDLLKAALRQRPEYLLVGEVRGKEALTLFQAMSTGHTTFSTMHADSVASAIHRLENPPISVPRTMIQALDIMSIQSQTYTKGKRVRRNIKLVEIVDIDPNTRNIRTNDIFVWDSESDMFIRTGESKALFDIKMRRGWAQGKVDQELYYRQKILEYMADNGITDFQEISDIINAYQSTPEKVLKKLQLV